MTVGHLVDAMTTLVALTHQATRAAEATVGELKYTLDAAMTGWVPCDGAMLTQAAHGALYARIGNAYVPADTTAYPDYNPLVHFFVPDIPPSGPANCFIRSG